MTLLKNFAITLLLIHGSASFTIQNGLRPSTKLFLEDNVAEMIDLELLRHHDKEAYAKQRKEHNAKILPENFEEQLMTMNYADPDQEDKIQYRRDARLVRNSPERYCAERCVSTGNCDVFEDMFDMDARQVMEFCTDCVLGTEENEPCDIPDKMLDGPYPDLSLRP